MRPSLLLGWGAAVALAAPAPIFPDHGVQIDDSDLLKVRQEHAQIDDTDLLKVRKEHSVQIDDSDLLKARHASPDAQELEDMSHQGCILIKFFREAPQHISKSMSRLKSAGTHSRILPVFWLGRKHDGQAYAASLEATEINELHHGGEILYLTDGEHQSWGRHHSHRGHRRRSHPIIHTVMVWAHVISFMVLIGFTFMYIATFVLHKTRKDRQEFEADEPQHVFPDEKRELMALADEEV